MQPRFRMFAGPNGSGKSVLFEHLKDKGYIHTELYVSADRIEKDLKTTGKFYFSSYRIKVSESEFKSHILSSGLFQKLNDDSFLEELQLTSGILSFNGKAKTINSYMASFIATFLCAKLIETGQSFCFETVLSHPSKIELLALAKSFGYKTYLYFIFTENWQLNVERVKLRVLDGGHNVSHKKIESRYYKSLTNFSFAAQVADSTFLIDNSKVFTRIAELINGKPSYLIDPFPEWFREYYNPES